MQFQLTEGSLFLIRNRRMRTKNWTVKKFSVHTVLHLYC